MKDQNPGGSGIIIGGGIAGLCAAIALQQLDIPVRIFEAAPEVLPVGAGIWMAPNAMQVFDRLGIAELINENGVPLSKIQVTDNCYRPIMRTNQENIRKRFGYTTTAIRRSKLQEILIAKAGKDSIALAKKCISVHEEEGRVRVCFADGTDTYAPFVIAADGVNSGVRKQLFPNVVIKEKRYEVWRGISYLQLKPEFKKAIIEVWHGGLRFGFSEVRDGEVDWFAVKKQSDSSSNNGMQQHLLAAFREFGSPVDTILSAANESNFIKNTLTDFNPIPQWHKGRVCLIGDAAHASTPYMGQGGCQAVEDAYVLAQCLHKESTVSGAFAAMQHIRRRKAVQIVNTSRMMGHVGYLKNGMGTLRNFVIRSVPLTIIERQFVGVYSLNY